jgi:hypothetical protein
MMGSRLDLSKARPPLSFLAARCCARRRGRVVPIELVSPDLVNTGTQKAGEDNKRPSVGWSGQALQPRVFPSSQAACPWWHGGYDRVPAVCMASLWGTTCAPRQVPGAVIPWGGPRQVTKQSVDGKAPSSPPVRRKLRFPSGGTRRHADRLTTEFPTASSIFSTHHRHQAPHIPSQRPEYHPRNELLQ